MGEVDFSLSLGSDTESADRHIGLLIRQGIDKPLNGIGCGEFVTQPHKLSDFMPELDAVSSRLSLIQDHEWLSFLNDDTQGRRALYLLRWQGRAGKQAESQGDRGTEEGLFKELHCDGAG